MSSTLYRLVRKKSPMCEYSLLRAAKKKQGRPWPTIQPPCSTFLALLDLSFSRACSFLAAQLTRSFVPFTPCFVPSNYPLTLKFGNIDILCSLYLCFTGMFPAKIKTGMFPPRQQILEKPPTWGATTFSTHCPTKKSNRREIFLVGIYKCFAAQPQISLAIFVLEKKSWVPGRAGQPPPVSDM